MKEKLKKTGYYFHVLIEKFGKDEAEKIWRSVNNVGYEGGFLTKKVRSNLKVYKHEADHKKTLF